MNKLFVFSAIMLVSAFISAISQILLKLAAENEYKNKIGEYINLKVIFAYGLFLLSTLVSVFSLKYVPLSLSPILESSAYIYVTILSYIILKERMNKKQLLGMILILIGIFIVSLEFINI